MRDFGKKPPSSPKFDQLRAMREAQFDRDEKLKAEVLAKVKKKPRKGKA